MDTRNHEIEVNPAETTLLVRNLLKFRSYQSIEERNLIIKPGEIRGCLARMGAANLP